MIAYLFSIFIVAPFAGAQLEALLNPKVWLAIPLLHEPIMPGVFIGFPEPRLNAPMWTISYEFRCYLLVIVIGLFGLLSKRTALVVVTATALFVSSFNHTPALNGWFPDTFSCGLLVIPTRQCGLQEYLGVVLFIICIESASVTIGVW